VGGGQGSWAGPSWFRPGLGGWGGGWVGGEGHESGWGGAKGPRPGGEGGGWGGMGMSVGGGGGGKGFFSKSMVFNYFRHDKSEPDLKDDCIFTVFLNFLPNRFCFKPEPHELVWKSVTAILHRIFVSIFMIFFKLFKIWNQVSRFLIFQTQKMCFWAWGRFGMSNNLPICLPICKCSTNSL
jgi:hypothetical protein